MTGKLSRRDRIKMGIRKRLSGSTERPRLSVYRSNKGIYAQIIDDVKGITLASASSLSKEFATTGNKSDQSTAVGKMIAERAVAAGIKDVVFDRNGYLYHGRVKSLAEGAREGGLNF
jgi:large subunit ribosomal protein L18